MKKKQLNLLGSYGLCASKRLDDRAKSLSFLNPEEWVSDYDVSKEEPISHVAAYNAFGEQHENIITRSLFKGGSSVYHR